MKLPKGVVLTRGPQRERYERTVDLQKEPSHDSLMMEATRRPTKRLSKRRRDRDRRRALLLEALRAYGGKCECCGETEPLFLTIDHMQKRPEGEPSGWQLYQMLKSMGWPKDKYRLLCFNCNCGRERNGGVCPHHRSAYSTYA